MAGRIVNPLVHGVETSISAWKAHRETLELTKFSEAAKGEWRQLSDEEIDRAVAAADRVIANLEAALAEAVKLEEGTF